MNHLRIVKRHPPEVHMPTRSRCGHAAGAQGDCPDRTCGFIPLDQARKNIHLGQAAGQIRKVGWLGGGG